MNNSNVTDIPTTFQPSTEPADGHIPTWALTLIGFSSLLLFAILLYVLCRCVRRRSEAPVKFVSPLHYPREYGIISERNDGDGGTYDNPVALVKRFCLAFRVLLKKQIFY